MSENTVSEKSTADQLVDHGRLEHFPIGFFAMSMGLGGFSIATHKLEQTLGLTNTLSTILVGITTLVFILTAILYITKLIRYPAAVSDEWTHPVKISFFPAITIAVIILSTCFLPLARDISHILWWIGAPLNIVATFAVVSAWINHDRYREVHLNPAWFIPAVGNVLAPIAGVVHAPLALNWFFFATGIIFWIVLLTIVFNRFVFHNPLPGRLMPTMFILVAPPAVAFLAYMRLNDNLDPFAHILYHGGPLFFVLVVLQARKLLQLEFSLPWWAYSFPMAALTISTLRYAELTASSVITVLGLLFYALLILIIATLLFKTVRAIVAEEICQPE
jgi:tellurite resistance protein